MFSSVYTGMSGMMAYSSGLDTISNNVANLNTPGYKGRELLFRDVFYSTQSMGDNSYNNSSHQLGGGVIAEESSLSFRQGEVRKTGSSTDVAINGNGFFILQDEGNTYYTRAGQFEFNQDGILVAKGSNASVMALDGNGNLVEISINGIRTDPGNSTTEVRFANNLARGQVQFTITDVEIFDANGEKHVFNITLTENSAFVPTATESNSYFVDVKEVIDGVAQDIGIPTGEIRFQGNGAIAQNFNSYVITFNPADAAAQDINLYFGDPGTHSGTTNYAGVTTGIRVDSHDGYGIGSLTNFGFERTGEFFTNYSNGQTHNRSVLALGWFNDVQKLQELGGGLFHMENDQNPIISTPTKDGLGELAGSSIELSNVELTQQFTNMIIIQRGYQASSQVLTVANEMAQQLLSMSRGQ